MSLITLFMVAVIEMPPKKYDHEPYQPYQVIEMPIKDLHKICNQPRRSNYTLFGCAHHLVGLIYLRDDLSDEARKRVLRHERAHLNGWKHR